MKVFVLKQTEENKGLNLNESTMKQLLDAVKGMENYKFAVEDLVITEDEELGMVIGVDENDSDYPYLVRVGGANKWFAEHEMELADIDALLDEGEEYLFFI